MLSAAPLSGQPVGMTPLQEMVIVHVLVVQPLRCWGIQLPVPGKEQRTRSALLLG